MSILPSMQIKLELGDVEILRILMPNRTRTYRRGRLVREKTSEEIRYSVFIGDNEAIRGMTASMLNGLVAKGMIRQFHP